MDLYPHSPETGEWGSILYFSEFSQNYFRKPIDFFKRLCYNINVAEA